MTRGRDAKSNAIIFSQGEYRLPSDSVYVEILGKSSDPVFIEGTENEISVERLHDNLIKLSFSMPDKEKRWVEYWFLSLIHICNRMSEEAVRMAVSLDGYNYKALNGNQPVLDSRVISSTAVSYTHLDVYKRQVQGIRHEYYLYLYFLEYP